MKQLQRQLKNLQSELENIDKRSTTSQSSNQSRSSSDDSQSQYRRNSVKDEDDFVNDRVRPPSNTDEKFKKIAVDEELKKLKDKMGLK